MTDDRDRLAEILRAHTVRGRRCSCARHFDDGRPEFCDPGYHALPAADQQQIAGLRSGIVIDPEARAIAGRPPRYGDGDPIPNPIDNPEWRF
jgi:hypothetical protein